MDDANDSDHNVGKHMRHLPEIEKELSNISPLVSDQTASTATVEPLQQLKITTKKRKLITDGQQVTGDRDEVNDSVSTTANKSKKPTLLDDIRENKKKEKSLTDMICNAMSK